MLETGADEYGKTPQEYSALVIKEPSQSQNGWVDNMNDVWLKLF